MYKVIKRWYLSDGENPAEIGWETIGSFRKIRKARRAMHADVRQVEIMNEYRSPFYSGADNTQRSVSLSRDRHLYDISDSNGSHVEWLVSRRGLFTDPIGSAIL